VEEPYLHDGPVSWTLGDKVGSFFNLILGDPSDRPQEERQEPGSRVPAPLKNSWSVFAGPGLESTVD